MPSEKDRRAGPPHIRIVDEFYKSLKEFTPYETKLWLAIRFLATRKSGSQQGLVRKSIRRIAKDIGMPETTARRALEELEKKRVELPDGQIVPLLERVPSGIRLSGGAVATPVATPLPQENKKRICASQAQGCAHQAHECASQAQGAPTRRTSDSQTPQNERVTDSPGGLNRKRIGSGSKPLKKAAASNTLKAMKDITPTSSVEPARLKAGSTGDDGKGTSSMNTKPLGRSELKQMLGRILEAAEQTERKKLPRREVAEREHKQLDEDFEKRKRMLRRQGELLKKDE